MNRTKILEEIQKNVELLSTTGLAEYKYIPLHQKPSPSVTALREIMSLLRKVIFPGFFGNKGAFSRTELQVDAYHQVWKGGVMAYDLYGVFNYGNTPWTMLALMGGSTRMRG